MIAGEKEKVDNMLKHIKDTTEILYTRVSEIENESKKIAGILGELEYNTKRTTDEAIDGTVRISDYLNEIMEQVATLQELVTM